jgi:hypothetical protein
VRIGFTFRRTTYKDVELDPDEFRGLSHNEVVCAIHAALPPGGYDPDEIERAAEYLIAAPR